MMDLTPPFVVDPHALLVAPDEYDNPLLQFLHMPPKSNFKSLLTTSLRQKLIAMSNSKAVPEGLKDQECKKGSRAKRPPIPYVPVINPVQDVVNIMGNEHPMKTKIQVPIWHQGMPEAFLFKFAKRLAPANVKGISLSTKRPLMQS